MSKESSPTTTPRKRSPHLIHHLLKPKHRPYQVMNSVLLLSASGEVRYVPLRRGAECPVLRVAAMPGCTCCLLARMLLLNTLLLMLLLMLLLILLLIAKLSVAPACWWTVIGSMVLLLNPWPPSLALTYGLFDSQSQRKEAGDAISREQMRIFLLACVTATTTGLVHGPWSDMAMSASERAQRLVSNMTLNEQLQFLHGTAMVETNKTHGEYTGNLLPLPRLGIPPVSMNDGPQGFRPGGTSLPGTSTAWPSGLTIAASWDVDAVYEWGVGTGREFYEKGANTMLGPGLCLARIPRNGRNFEYMSGEDPVLGRTMASAAVRGIQSQKVVATAKHFVMNNQETDRTTVSAEVDERTRFELYYPPFEGAIDADVGSVMCSYNKIHGMWSCENPDTLRELRSALGFKGYVMSDWMATHSASIMAGLDVEMPYNASMIPSIIKPALEAGTITLEAIRTSVVRILTPMFAVGVMDEPLSAWDPAKRLRNVSTATSIASARHLSAQSTVLLKNANGVLPIPQGKKVALVGFASGNAIVHGGGSGSVTASYVATPLAGITAAAGAGSEVHYNDGTNLTAAAELAQVCDYVIVFVGTLSSEGGDRTSLSLDDGCNVLEGQCVGNAHNQTQMVHAMAAANARTIVVASVPGAVTMPWSQESHVAAIMVNFMGGQEAGNAIADVLFGKVNPSGKLPITFPNHENETRLTTAQWPGLPLAPAGAKIGDYSFYTEKLQVGYRYYDAHGISFSTGFPFGHGLSYTMFEYASLTVSATGMAVSFTVKNSGAVAGSEVAQLYIGYPPAAGEPPLQLKSFHKTKKLAPGETAMVTLALTKRDFSIWDAQAHKWSMVQGTFELDIGSSSRDIRLRGTTKF